MNSDLPSCSSRMSPGSSPLKPMARWNDARGVWETDQATLCCGQQAVFTEIFPRSVTVRGSVLYEQPMSEPLIVARGSSFSLLLKTPTAQLAVNGGSQHPVKRTAGGHGPTLADEVEHLLPTPRCQSGTGAEYPENNWTGVRPSGAKQALNLATAVSLLPTPNTMDSLPPKTQEQIQAHRDQGKGGDRNLREAVLYELENPISPAEENSPRVEGSPLPVEKWGKYAPAIQRWEEILGRPAPDPTEPGKTAPRLSPRFAEWIMGLPEGWVTDVPDVDRKGQLHALGNGVVPQQAAAALRILLERMQA